MMRLISNKLLFIPLLLLYGLAGIITVVDATPELPVLNDISRSDTAWLDFNRVDTVVFPVKSADLMNGKGIDNDPDTFTTAGISVSISGEPVIFYLRWIPKAREDKCIKPVIVAKGKNWKSLGENLKFWERNYIIVQQLLAGMSHRKMLEFISINLKKMEPFDLYKVDDDEHVMLDALEYPFRLYPRYTMKLSEASIQTGWKRKEKLMSLVVTDESGEMQYAELPTISFLEQNKNYLYDGFEMDGANLRAFKKRFGNNELNSSEQLHQYASDPVCNSSIERNRFNTHFWRQINSVLRSDNSPETLYFRLTLYP
ncbi:hypothetical protein EOPP23_09940 [Endozoicomonas sp. OPT23]|uniref:hypothetical protein n=1 Tax=Endozoicomonas sp. OPT23 TaxID=2072845 RepID=UPI00129AFB2E|nr:hypothetical protein [Endozoicomonas sp. OPT23]MRI33303.1 hypothetical protein [Endozoicomonas sp. OPT23]